jgi:hypothetical protein
MSLGVFAQLVARRAKARLCRTRDVARPPSMGASFRRGVTEERLRCACKRYVASLIRAFSARALEPCLGSVIECKKNDPAYPAIEARCDAEFVEALSDGPRGQRDE